MIVIKSILNKINARIDNIQNEDKSKYPDDYKKHLSVEEAVYRRIRDEIEFQSLSPSEKQAKRINSLASCRKTHADCSRKLLTIQIYDTITVSMPYLKVLNHGNRLSLIGELCLKELNLIDDNQLGDVKKHVTKEEIEEAFKPYFETITPFKMDMLKECYEKMENLYYELLKLNENS
jgi:hypothetical protein